MADQQSAGNERQPRNQNQNHASADTGIAWPIADPALTQEILDIVQQASHYRQLKKGANEGKLPSSQVLLVQRNRLLTFSRSDQNPKPRYLRNYHSRCRYRSPRHSPPPAAPV